MKTVIEYSLILVAVIVLAFSSKSEIKAPSVPALPPHPSSKAISNVGMTPDYALSAAADAGKATQEIASTMPAATAPSQDALNPEAVVSLPLTETSEDFQQATAVQERQESAMVQACNATRARYGVAPCRESAALTAAAQGYANYLYRTRQQGHYANGSPEQRAAAAGFTGSLLTPGVRKADGWTSYGVGEVLSFGASDPFGAWLQSSGHKAALLERSYDVAGFGICGSISVGMLGNSRTPHAQFVNTAVARSETGVGSSYPKPLRTLPTAVYSTCGPNGFRQVFVPQQPQQPRPRQYVQQPQQWQYQRPGLFGWRR